MTQQYPKRLIEVDLPIKRISAHARREKSIRHGNISTLHIWWARRPLAACRAVICAALWPDPTDPLCPQDFRNKASRLITAFASAAVTNRELAESCNQESWMRWQALVNTGGLDGRKEADWSVLRIALMDFIADFANWDNATVKEYVDASRALTQAAHEALGGEAGTRPLLVDPFAGGGSIPLEALRIGADTFASDLNPLPVLLNKVVIEYIPKYGERLIDEVRKWGHWVQQEAEKELAEFYPNDPDGATPIAYLWARTIQCEGPGCSAEVPLIRSLWLARTSNRSIALQLVSHPKTKRVDFKIIVKQHSGWVEQDDSNNTIANPKFDGTVKRGSATCPCCGYTTPVARVRNQLKSNGGGANQARLFCVVVLPPDSNTREFRRPRSHDIEAFQAALAKLNSQKASQNLNQLPLIPNEKIPMTEIRRISVPIYGMTTWGHLFSSRQLLALTTLVRLLTEARGKLAGEDPELAAATATVVGLGISRFADICNALCMWETSKTQVRHMFTRQAIGMLWDFAEPNIFADAAGNFAVTLGTMIEVLANQVLDLRDGRVEQVSATEHLLPADSANALITDPPYYDAVPYAHLSDFFYVWLRRGLSHTHKDLFHNSETPKAAEIVVDRPHELSASQKDIAFYERKLTEAFSVQHRVLRSDGIAIIVFASKTTSSWEAILKAVVEAGWIITGSWPIDTELENRVAAQGQARLTSSVHLVCRRREIVCGLTSHNVVGDWRDILTELPKRIHDWMPRLAEEGVVGADAIFACLGPALEIFSRYERVERASGELVTLKEYLEHVWAAVAKEALVMVFKGADATGFEADARLTAMWLWTLRSPDGNGNIEDTGNEEDSEDEADTESAKAKTGRFMLEYDAARKIAQGLGAHLESLSHLVEITGDQAHLLPVSQRTQHLFGKNGEEPGRTPGRKKKPSQLDMFAELTGSHDAEAAWKEKTVKRVGETTLDRVHQGMILFGAGRGEALKRFVVEDGVGRDGKFWRLAQALSALYPSGSDEKRWVDGVLARKKQFGF
jgi:adenine-specific DNA methylase